MIKRNKWLLGFSLIYWLLIILGVVLNILALQKVPLQTYGLRAYFFNPSVDATYYIPGLYHINVGYYFITFPSSKQYIVDNKVYVVNKNLQKIEVTYSLCYRVNPNRIYYLYQRMGTDYEQYLIAAVNNIISSVFMTLKQSDSRVTAQAQIVTNINAANNKIAIILDSAIAVEGLWLNEVSFPQLVQKQYENSLYLSDSYEQSYQTTQMEYQRTRLKVQAIQQQIALLKSQLNFTTKQTYLDRYRDVVATDLALQQVRQTRFSYNFLMKRIWTYYNSTKLVFDSNL